MQIKLQIFGISLQLKRSSLAEIPSVLSVWASALNLLLIMLATWTRTLFALCLALGLINCNCLQAKLCSLGFQGRPALLAQFCLFSGCGCVDFVIGLVCI